MNRSCFGLLDCFDGDVDVRCLFRFDSIVVDSLCWFFEKNGDGVLCLRWL